MTGSSSFKVGIEFESVLRAISKQIYETPMAFIRENVQNAVDAIRIQALRDGIEPSDPRYKIDVHIKGRVLTVRDNGIGMTASDLQNFFWTIGASGKRTGEAQKAGCVGMFGIGGFANFGVCDKLEVISQTEDASSGTYTSLSQDDIKASGVAIPSVTVKSSNDAAPRGTIVIGHLRETPNVDELRRYLRDFVRFVPILVTFDGEKLSQSKFSAVDDRENLKEVGDGVQTWRDGDLAVTGRLFEDKGHALIAGIEGLSIGDEAINFVGQIRFENGAIDAFKRGFKLCATQIGTVIGVSGRLDSDRFMPTAGRDSLDSTTTSLLGRIVALLERVAVEKVLESPERIAQHTRIFRYVVKRGMVAGLDHARVRLADGSETSLGDIKRRSAQGIGVYFGTAQKQALNQIMQARGHIVVLLSADQFRRNAEQSYLQQFCGAKPFDGIIDCTEHYKELSRFERVFLSELEMTISKSYEVHNFRLLPGKLTEDIPVFVREHTGTAPIDIYVDVRHQEIVKLESLGFNQLLYSLIASFCREYLGPSLKKWSPRFFGDGAINLEMLAKRRSELWILLKDDIGTVRKGGQRQIVTRSDVQVVKVGGGGQAQPEADAQPQGDKKPRILHIIDDTGQTELSGFYIRIPESAFRAYGDLLPECDSRGVVWAGNKIMYVASDTVSASFQYEIRLDEIVAAEVNGTPRAEGAVPLERPIQEMFGGAYFPIPQPLKSFLVPKNNVEIRLELHCDWIDMRTAKHWAAEG
ncbi:ATP-binding protein [Bradyrhizobium sp. LHD-71]|uniref:ATP-binding protein n=1 Tax=Bradyrhizobium sp. LHD-71 TaxID=3072141 RepID=UPI00280D67F7|nr:ATP-binding protein [Bradyrhizobium sp. LHD-71]MDQ8727386.1 ATP-binding protein [Bradyrhizobium sp. LHD-71]